MTILGGIIDAIDGATSGWSVEAGFNADISDWIEQKRSTGKTILVSFDGIEPSRHGEGGRSRGVTLSFSVWMRARADRMKFETQIWPQFKALRRALDGLVVEEDGERYQVMIGAGRPAMTGGYGIPTLLLTVIG